MSEITEARKQELLQTMADDGGYDDVSELLEMASSDSIVAAICTDCEAQYELEPDAEDDLCEMCDGETVSSCLVLAGII